MTPPVAEVRWVPFICDASVPLADDEDRRCLWQDLSAVRGGDRMAEIERSIRWATEGEYMKHFVTGHIGCGKSTELMRLKSNLEQEKEGKTFHVVYIDAQENLDVADVQFPDFLVSLVPALAADPALHFPVTSSGRILWDEIRERVKQLGVEIEAGIDTGGPSLRALLVKSPGFQPRLRENVRKQSVRLMELLSDALREVRAQLVRNDIDDLVIMVDNLEKMPRQPVAENREQNTHDLFFVEQIPHIRDLPVHLILTYPVGVHYAHTQLRTRFPASSIFALIPMINVGKPRSPHDADGVSTLMRVLGTRVNLSTVFAGTAAEDAVRSSGGCLKDLLRLVAQAALMKGGLPLSPADIETAVAEHVNMYERVLQGRPFLADLHHVARSGSMPPGLPEDQKQWLLQELVVLEYDGHVWYGVHPFAERTRAYREAVPAQSPGAVPPPAGSPAGTP